MHEAETCFDICQKVDYRLCRNIKIVIEINAKQRNELQIPSVQIKLGVAMTVTCSNNLSLLRFRFYFQIGQIHKFRIVIHYIEHSALIDRNTQTYT